MPRVSRETKMTYYTGLSGGLSLVILVATMDQSDHAPFIVCDLSHAQKTRKIEPSDS